MGDGRVMSVGNNMISNTLGVDLAKRHGEVSDIMFSDMISLGMQTQPQKKTFETNEDAGVETINESFEKFQYKEKNIGKTSEQKENCDAEKLKQTFESFSKKVTEALKQDLQVTEEEIQNALETLGLQLLDLLDVSNLSNVMVELGCGENVSQLLCSEIFATVRNSITELGNELLEELQIPIDEWKEVFAFKQVLEDSSSNVSEPELDEAIITSAPSQTQAGDIQNETIEVLDVRVEEQKPEKAELQDEKMNSSDMDQGNLDKEEMPKEAKGAYNRNQGNVFETESHVLEQPISETIGTKLGNTTVESLPSYISVSDIMEQFVEHTRVTISTEITKMEMQLNPEHLGKIYLEISENQGSVTAKIQAQNAVVKEALETQIADLKQNLNQAGVKVDAIEVTIASHEFERNLEQGEDSKNQQEESTKKQSRNRNIHMDGLENGIDLLSEEDALIAKMMSEQGNRVDLTA